MLKQTTLVLLGLCLVMMTTYGRRPPPNDDQDVAAERRSMAKSRMLARRIHWAHPARSSYVKQRSPFRQRSSIDDPSQFQQDMLKAHNEYRARHCTSPLELDDDLNRQAMEYAQHLASIDQMEHSSGTDQGENLNQSEASQGITSIDGAGETKYWYDEVNLYDFNNPGSVEGADHFSQVVWKGSQRLGAGFAITADGKKLYVVARYLPQGNIVGNYQENVLQATC